MSASEESILTAFKRRHRPIVTISRSPSLPTRLKPPPYPRPCPTNVVFCHRVLFFGRFEQDAIWILDGGKRPVTNIRSVTWPGLCTGRAWVCWSLRRRRLGSTDGLFVVWADFECWWEGVSRCLWGGCCVKRASMTAGRVSVAACHLSKSTLLTSDAIWPLNRGVLDLIVRWNKILSHQLAANVRLYYYVKRIPIKSLGCIFRGSSLPLTSLCSACIYGQWRRSWKALQC